MTLHKSYLNNVTDGVRNSSMGMGAMHMCCCCACCMQDVLPPGDKLGQR